jgi:hypothetical protein
MVDSKQRMKIDSLTFCVAYFPKMNQLNYLLQKNHVAVPPLGWSL